MICSDEVNRLDLYGRAEKGFILKPETINRYSTSMYCRFKDDILIGIGGTADDRRRFVNDFSRVSGHFKFKVESISRDEAVMLDLRLFRGPRYVRLGILEVGMYFKKSLQGVPLSSLSWHYPAVHRS